VAEKRAGPVMSIHGGRKLLGRTHYGPGLGAHLGPIGALAGDCTEQPSWEEGLGGSDLAGEAQPTYLATGVWFRSPPAAVIW